jgi:glycine/D-amino acid oxidase-like deaminating enzyme/nitrite reductase/ring-hydroxylating ferredoxin subunit
MNAADEASRPLWSDVEPVAAPALTRDLSIDVLVVGAGIAGLSAAYELARTGRSIAVIDRGRLAGGMSARTSAHLSWELDDYYCELIDLRGLDEARQYLASQQAAVERIAEIARSEAIDCDFARIDAYLFAHNMTDGSKLLEREYKAAQAVGFTGVEWVDTVPRLATGRCLRFPNQARFHPTKYLRGLVEALRRRGVQLFGDTAIVDVAEAQGHTTAKTEAGHTVTAAAAVIATNTPINDRVAIHTKQAPYRTYVLAAPVPKGSAPDALVWDTDDPYHYVRIQPARDHDWLIVGGEDHKTGHADDGQRRIARLHAWARNQYPQIGETACTWSGQVFEPVDFVPFAGRNPGNQHVYVITGDSGEGLTTGVAASLIIADLIDKRASPWADAYRPNRKTLGALGDFVSENLDAARQMTEHLHAASGEIASLDALQPGTGALISLDGRKLAAYRRQDGGLLLRSATCPHVGCIVHWNSFERCWDCPCHGSQFAPDGAALAGPARSGLAPVAETDRTKPG